MSPMSPTIQSFPTTFEPHSADPSASAGARLMTLDGRALALRDTELRVTAEAGLARVLVVQRFANQHAEPLEVLYRLPLPADAAVSGFAFGIGERRVVGEVDRRARARERYEEALLDGRSAALLDEERSSVFTQRIGNVPPGAEIVAEITLDQPLAWCEEGAWEWRFPTVITPAYMGASGRVRDVENVSVEIADPAGVQPALRGRLVLCIRDALGRGAEPSSPSHAILARRASGDATPVCEVTLADASGARLDRDVAVRWPVARPDPGVSLVVGRPDAARPHAKDAYALLTIVPPQPAHALPAQARDVTLLLDVSGSMGGLPIEILRRLATSVVESLGTGDRLEMIAFASQPERWRAGPLALDAGVRADARAWIAKLQAGGGTEMRDAIRAALAPLRDEAQHQVIIVTDGAIGFESEIVYDLDRRRPQRTRVHVAAVGHAPNRTLSRGASRAGRGVELIVQSEAEVPRAVSTLLARTVAPAITELCIGGPAVRELAPQFLPDVFAGAPVRVALRLAPEGGPIALSGQTARGPWSAALVAPSVAAASGSAAVVTLFARERVEDLEAVVAFISHAGDDGLILEALPAGARIEQIGLDFQIATSHTSWIAISEERDVDPTRPTRREVVPQALPCGTSVEGLGLRSAQGFGQGVAMLHSLREPGLDAEMFVFDRRSGMPHAAASESMRPTRVRRVVGIPFRLRGVRRVGHELVISLDALADTNWECPAEVRLRGLRALAGEIEATVNRARSTASRELRAGSEVRLVVDARSIPENAGPWTLVIPRLDGDDLVVELGAA